MTRKMRELLGLHRLLAERGIEDASETGEAAEADAFAEA